jgi:hypothetical protein
MRRRGWCDLECRNHRSHYTDLKTRPTINYRLAQSCDAKSGKIETSEQARGDAAACQNVRMAGT